MLHPNKPPLATVGRALTLIQVIFYLPLTLDVGGEPRACTNTRRTVANANPAFLHAAIIATGPDAFLALSASLASYYWALSSLRLVTKGTRVQWIGDLCAVFQFLVVPACLAVCWAVYCPPENNYFFVRWARSVGVNPTTSSTTAWSPHLHPATPPHLAAIVQAVRPILQRDTHPYLEYLFDVSSKVRKTGCSAQWWLLDEAYIASRRPRRASFSSLVKYPFGGAAFCACQAPCSASSKARRRSSSSNC